MRDIDRYFGSQHFGCELPHAFPLQLVVIPEHKAVQPQTQLGRQRDDIVGFFVPIDARRDNLIALQDHTRMLIKDVPDFLFVVFAGEADDQALRDQSLLAYRKSVLTALQEVEDAMVAGSNEQKRCASLIEAVAANRRAVELSTQLYTAGQTDFINVLNAQRSLLQSESELTLSHLAMATDLIALYKALGGGW